MRSAWSAWAGSEPHPQRPSNGNFLFELEHSPAAPVQPSRARGEAFDLISRSLTATCAVWGD